MQKILFPILFFLISVPTFAAGDTTVRVTDQDHKIVRHAVITLTPLDGQDLPASTGQTPDENPAMSQQDLLFDPFVLPVSVGSEVSFPNRDSVRHHVYSFSRAKGFELRLYGNTEEKAITFDKTGVVAIGCNIHDNMLAFIYVTDAPVFMSTGDSGTVLVKGLSSGRYKATVWHPDITDDFTTEVTITPEDTMAQELSISLNKPLQVQKKPGEGRY